ncbi:family 4 glycosyltransferase [Xylogone sp. PMI_703]|nr:family 4 glycosyltransferase [Xylogone sp. PMI_703]
MADSSAVERVRKASWDGDNLEFPPALKGKRILLATESFGPVNGVSRTTLMLVQYLRSHGVQVAVVAPHISVGAESSTVTSAPGQIEVRLQGYPLPYNPELSVVYPVRLLQLYARTFNAPPDLIYLASPASLGFQVLLQLRQQQESAVPPVLLNFQTDLSGYCEILFPAPLDKFASWVFNSVQGYLFRHPSVRTVFYPSLFVRRYLEKIGIQSEKMVNLRRGVNGELFHPSKRSEEMRKRLAPNNEIILLTVCRIAPEKGFEFLADVAKKLDALDFPFKLVIVGGNRNPQVETDIHNLFGDLATPAKNNKVTFTGFLQGEDLAQAYASADIFLHCSITETFGLVVLESMASGVPVIARDEGGPSDIVEHDKSGYLVPPSDLDGFVEKVLKIGNDEELRQNMSVQARLLANEATWEKINNTVAWKMADAIEERKSQTVAATSTTVVTSPDAPAAPAAQTTPAASTTTSSVAAPSIADLKSSFAIPVYTWLLLSQELRSLLTSLVVDARLVAGLGIIIGVWGGLVVTWILVQTSLAVRIRGGWLRGMMERFTAA